MQLITKAPRGTKDILPIECGKWIFLENLLREESENFGFKEIRTPVFEHTELFKRTVGEDTDVVQKEMYTFSDKSGRSITLRPEGTASTARAMLENSLHNGALPIKLSYFSSCYRYEKPQAGRWREFHQFGLEIFGSQSPFADAELINTAISIFKRLGLKNIKLQINTIGCSKCRETYYDELNHYFNFYKDDLCETCLERLKTNPMRILDCKNSSCQKLIKEAPIVIEFLCKECAEHFEFLKKYLTKLQIEYVVNPRIVRGLDYYTKTVFEFVSEELGTQAVVGGGGRYDNLVSQIGGKDIPALGFGIGMERLLLILEKQGISLPSYEPCELYIASAGEEGKIKAFILANQIRQAGIKTECDIVNRTMKSQMKYADKINAKYSIAIGEDEIKDGYAMLKNMETGETRKISIGEDFISSFSKAHVELENGDALLSK